jgi:hypothetical protein
MHRLDLTLPDILPQQSVPYKKKSKSEKVMVMQEHIDLTKSAFFS